MQLKMYERTWHGITLLSVPGAKPMDQELPDGTFFGGFYEMLERGEGRVANDWKHGKVELGKAIQKHFFVPFKEAHGRFPKVFAASTGWAYVEGQWAEGGCDVTFHEFADSTLDPIRQRFPNARFLAGDVRELQLAPEYDFIGMIGIDYCVTEPQMGELLARLGKGLAPGGKMILVSPNALTWRRYLGEKLKHFTGHYRKKPAIFWGYWHTPTTFARAAGAAGLKVDAVYHIGHDADNPVKLVPSTSRPLAMRWRDAHLMLVLSRA